MNQFGAEYIEAVEMGLTGGTFTVPWLPPGSDPFEWKHPYWIVVGD